MALDSDQQAAVRADDGPVCVIAGAGSGKTTVLTERIAFLIEQGRARADQILAITFTNRAAGELQERLLRRLGGQSEGLWAMTFHDACGRILRADGSAIGLPASFAICDEIEQLRLLASCLSELADDDWGEGNDLRRLLDLIGRAKVDAQSELPTPFARRLAVRYAERLRAAGALDFDDLILSCCLLFEGNEELRRRWQARFPYVLVDEYQDTNPLQSRWLELLCEQNGNLFVAGDPDQAIYGFRKATVEHILTFSERHPTASTYILERNYRSGQEILDSANALIARNRERYEKELRGCFDGATVTVQSFEDRGQEAEALAESISELLRGGLSAREIAVLVRTNEQRLPYLAALQLRGIDARGGSEGGWLERVACRSALSYLRLIEQSDHALAFEQAVQFPHRLSDRELAALRTDAQANQRSLLAQARLTASGKGSKMRPAARQRLGEFVELIDDLGGRRELSAVMLLHEALAVSGALAELEKRGDQDGADALSRLLVALSLAGEESLSETLSRLPELVRGDDEREAIALLTLHAAKGLEFEQLFLPACEQGILPHSQAVSEGTVEEERRLAFVAVTRAKRGLTISYTQQAPPSIFISELGLDLPSAGDEGTTMEEEGDSVPSLYDEWAGC